MTPDAYPEQVLALRPLAGEAERSLVLAVQRGNEEAFRELYEAYRKPIWALTLSLVGDRLQAQDILQNIFFKVYRGLDGFRFQAGLYTWIYQIALNECRNHLRKRSAPLVPLDAILGSRDEIDLTQATDRPNARRASLLEAVTRLPIKMREVIVLKYVEDLSYKEISRILRCPPGTVASRLNRALAELEVRLRPSRAGS